VLNRKWWCPGKAWGGWVELLINALRKRVTRLLKDAEGPHHVCDNRTALDGQPGLGSESGDGKGKDKSAVGNEMNKLKNARKIRKTSGFSGRGTQNEGYKGHLPRTMKEGLSRA